MVEDLVGVFAADKGDQTVGAVDTGPDGLIHHKLGEQGLGFLDKGVSLNSLGIGRAEECINVRPRINPTTGSISWWKYACSTWPRREYYVQSLGSSNPPTTFSPAQWRG